MAGERPITTLIESCIAGSVCPGDGVEGEGRGGGGGGRGPGGGGEGGGEGGGGGGGAGFAHEASQAGLLVPPPPPRVAPHAHVVVLQT